MKILNKFTFLFITFSFVFCEAIDSNKAIEVAEPVLNQVYDLVGFSK